MTSLKVYKDVNHHRRRVENSLWATDQGLTRVSPVEFDAHVELGVGSAAEHQPLPHRQPHLRRGQGEVIDLVSCGKGRGDMAVNPWPIVLLRLATLSAPTLPGSLTSPSHQVSLSLYL